MLGVWRDIQWCVPSIAVHTELFHHPPKFSMLYIFFPSYPQPLTATELSTVSIGLPFPEGHTDQPLSPKNACKVSLCLFIAFSVLNNIPSSEYIGLSTHLLKGVLVASKSGQL